jgi:hypothetical protein
MSREIYELKAAQRFGANQLGKQEKKETDEEGNSCRRRELWNNLAHRALLLLENFPSPEISVGKGTGGGSK